MYANRGPTVHLLRFLPRGLVSHVRLRLATAGTERGIWCTSAPATGKRMEDRLSQQEVEHEANAVRNDHGQRRPGNWRHSAPNGVCVNIAGEKKVSAGKRPARQTGQGPEGHDEPCPDEP